MKRVFKLAEYEKSEYGKATYPNGVPADHWTRICDGAEVKNEFITVNGRWFSKRGDAGVIEVRETIWERLAAFWKKLIRK
jgi:hypothetical protein